ncbi:UNVERIFIED_CONTAM: hypothetical protein K2H54_044518 [Gekko kuhli]
MNYRAHKNLISKIGPIDNYLHKMAADKSNAETEMVPVTAQGLTAALAAMEDRLLEKVSMMIKPIYDRLDSVQDSLKETRRVADGALSKSIANHKEIQQMQETEDLLAERTLKLDLSSRQNNLKLRGLGEKIEEKSDLAKFLSKSLTKARPIKSSPQRKVYVYCRG